MRTISLVGVAVSVVVGSVMVNHQSNAMALLAFAVANGFAVLSHYRQRLLR
jgi:hypothetical protein